MSCAFFINLYAEFEDIGGSQTFTMRKNKYLNSICFVLLLFTCLPENIPIRANNIIVKLGLFVWQKNGERTIIAINSFPKVTYSEKNNTLNITNSENQFAFEFNTVEKFTFKEYTHTKHDNIYDEKDYIISFNNNLLSISNLKPNSSIYIYDTYGQLIKFLQSDNNGYICYPINSHHKIYIIKTELMSFKIITQ